jgi:RimJ/RimL family protein N-acetyltransferase
MSELRTDRLLLRHWQESDLDPWAALNADPTVREHFPTVETREQSAESMALIAAALTERGWGLWALEVRDTGEFIGFTGLNPVHGLPFEGVEVGWRLARYDGTSSIGSTDRPVDAYSGTSGPGSRRPANRSPYSSIRAST